MSYIIVQTMMMARVFALAYLNATLAPCILRHSLLYLWSSCLWTLFSRQNRCWWVGAWNPCYSTMIGWCSLFWTLDVFWFRLWGRLFFWEFFGLELSRIFELLIRFIWLFWASGFYRLIVLGSSALSIFHTFLIQVIIFWFFFKLAYVLNSLIFNFLQTKILCILCLCLTLIWYGFLSLILNACLNFLAFG